MTKKRIIRFNFSENDPEKRLLMKLLQEPEIRIEEAIQELGILVGRPFGELAPQNFEESKLYLSKQLEKDESMDSKRALGVIKNAANLKEEKIKEISESWRAYDVTVLGWVIGEYYNFEDSLLKKYEAKKTNDLGNAVNLRMLPRPVKIIPRPEEVVETVIIERKIDETYTRRFPLKRLKEGVFGYLCEKLMAGPYTMKRTAVRSGLESFLEKNF